jgi:hypothetical protein
MILNLNVKEKPNRVELILNFDTPYELPLVKRKAKDRIDIVLKKVKLLAKWQKKLSSPFVYQIEATPLKNATLISFYTTNDPLFRAARSKDGLSLKLLLLPKKSVEQKKEGSFAFNINWQKILLWAGVAIAAIIALFLLLRIIGSGGRVRESKRIVVQPQEPNEFQILFEKPLDEHNKIALISFKDINYLVIIGSTNVLLGKYKKGEIESHEEFERAIESQDIAKAMEPKQEDEIFTTIEEYKRRASGDF